LIADGIGDIELEIVNVDSIRQQPVDEGAKREQVQRIDDEDTHVQEAERTELRNRRPLGLEKNRRSKGNEFEEEKKVGKRQIRGRLVKIKFVDRPNRQASQPRAAAKTDEQPERSQARAASGGVLKGENGSGSNQANLQEIADGGESEPVGKQQGSEQRRDHKCGDKYVGIPQRATEWLARIEGARRQEILVGLHRGNGDATHTGCLSAQYQVT
jgi:hypothetical protein